MSNPSVLRDYSDLQDFLLKRHKTRKPIRSWRDISIEICKATGQVINRGLLSNIARGKRKPANYIIEAINKTYHKRFKLHEITAHVIPCSRCGAVHVTKRCPQSAPKYKAHPVMRLSKLRRLMQSPYNAA